MVMGGVLALVLLLLSNGRFPALTAPIISNDIDQHRINSALPLVRDGLVIEQPFVAQHDGLTAVSLTLAKFNNIEQTEDSFLTVRLRDDADQIVAEETLLTQSLNHNHELQLQFDPIRDAMGQIFVIEVSGGEGTAFSVWGYDLDVYGGGAVRFSESGVETAVQDLHFSTQYRLTPAEVWRSLTTILRQDGLILLLGLLFLPLPGALALLAHSPSLRWDRAAWWGTAVALGAALWPLIWTFTSLLNLRWTPLTLWLAVILGWGLWIYITWQMGGGVKQLIINNEQSTVNSQQLTVNNQQSTINYQQSTIVTPSPRHLVTLSPLRPLAPSHYHLIFFLLLLLTLALRLLAVRDIAFPLWVDASRHGLITAVMTQSGQVITDYAPLLPIDRFPYHYGFHTLSASLMMMGDFPLERLLLIFGQLLNALVPLSLYAAVWLITRRRGDALFAAFLAGVPFFFPGYYATWGRFTQLTGMLIMPLLLTFSWKLVRGAKGWRTVWWMVSVLAAGLFLVHFRVFLFYVPFAILLFVVGRGRHGRYFLLAGGVTILLVGHRAWTLYQLMRTQLASTSGAIPNYNDFPTAYFNAGWDRYIIYVAIGLLPLAILGVWSRRRWGVLPLLMAAWTALLFAIVGGDWFGISTRSVVNLNSFYITIFVPLAIYLSIIVGQMGRWTRRLPLWGQTAVLVAFGGLCVILTLFGSRQQVEILNPATILGRPADVAALRWVEERTPNDARFVASSWLWLGETYAAQDGGAWIVPLTGRQSSIPPADYIYNRDLIAQVNAFNEAAQSVANWSTAETAVWLRDSGITHIFVGAGGGFLDPSELARNPEMEMVYGRDGAFIFKLR